MPKDDDQLEESSVLSENGIHLFSGDFDRDNVTSAIEFILEKNLLPPSQKPKHITLIINSEGGDLHQAFALVDIMGGSKIPVHTVGIGCVMSCGLIAFMSGERGHRSITHNTSILSHQFSWGTEGKEHELIATVKEYDLTKQRMLKHYKRYTGLSEKKILEVLMPPNDVYLSAQEALEYNLVDKIVSKI